MSLLISPASPLSPMNFPILLSSEYEVPYSKQPYLQSINISYTKPTIGFYENLNADPKIHTRLTKYFYYKLLDKWLYEDLIDILNYFKIKDGKVSLIDNLKEYDPTSVDKDSDENIQKKIDFIEKFFLTKNMMYKILSEYVKGSETGWIDLPKNDFFIKQVVEDKLIKKLKQLISEKNKSI